MGNSKTKIINGLKKLNEAVVEPDELEQNIDDLVVTAKDSLDIDDEQAKDFISGVVGEDAVSKSQQRFMGMVYNCKKTGDCASAAVKKAADSMSEKDAEDFASTKHKGLPEKVAEFDDEDYERAGREIEYGINPEVGADEYEELRRLKDTLVNGDDEGQPTDLEEGNDPEKLKRDVSIVMNKLDMSSIAPYIKKIDNPIEQAEMIGQFAEKIGVPRNQLSRVISNLRLLSKDDGQPEQAVEGKMTKKKLIETVTGKKENKVIKTVKVKDIK